MYRFKGIPMHMFIIVVCTVVIVYVSCMRDKGKLGLKNSTTLSSRLHVVQLTQVYSNEAQHKFSIKSAQCAQSF